MIEPTAIAVAPRGATEALHVLIERLAGIGVEVALVDDLRAAAELAATTPAAPPCILVDLRELVGGSDVEDVRVATDVIRRTAKAVPHVMPIAITGEADATLIVACIRAGAGDVIDLQLEGTGTARAVIQRVFQHQIATAGDAYAATNLRAMIEDLLKDLIRTERRVIDLEQQAAGRGTGETAAFGENRPAAILLVEPERHIADVLADRLEAEGLATFAYISGEDVVREVASLLAGGAGFDLALIAAQLPGIDGLETIRRLRDQIPGLPAFLMTSVHDADLAAHAADLGVVGFVHKPLPDMTEVVERLAQLARDSLHRTREHLYLQRIKARHERVLRRYRSLPREP